MTSEYLNTSSELSQPDKPSVFQKTRRFVVRGLKLSVGVILAYILILSVGLIPVNNDFVEPETGIDIYVSSNAVHADLVVPMANDVIDWRTVFPAEHFGYDVNEFSHVAIGWGDKGFFIDTPTWSDFKFSTAVNALLLSSPTCMHVSLERETFFPEGLRNVRISNDQYQLLVDYIRSSIQYKNDEAIGIANASYGRSDAFFEAVGNYHAFNTCNSWVGGGLKACGVRAPWLSPMPKSPFLYLPK